MPTPKALPGRSCQKLELKARQMPVEAKLSPVCGHTLLTLTVTCGRSILTQFVMHFTFRRKTFVNNRKKILTL